MTVLLAPLALAAACVETRADRILARDLVTAVPQLAAIPGDAVLGLAPRPGIERILRPAEIRSFAARWSLSVEAPEPICVTGRLRSIEAAEAQAALRAPMGALLGDAGAFEVLAVSSRPVPEGELVFPASGWSVEAKDRIRWRGHVVAASGAKYPVWAAVRAETAAVRRPARKPVPRDVKAGEDVRVTVTVGAARLSLDALAETSGRVGERVLLKNRESGRRFPAVVVGPGQARIGDDGDRQN